MKGKLTSYLNAWHASFIYVSCVYLPLERCLLKYVLVWLLLLVDLCNQKATKGTEIQFFYVRKASSKVEE